MFAPPMMDAPPVQSYPAPPQQMPSVPMVPASAPRAAAAPAPQIIARGKAPDDPVPARPPLLTMPSPEQLGVSVRPAAARGPDWTALHARMKQVGIVSFHVEALPGGRVRFTCWRPGAQPDTTQRIEAVADDEAEAVRLALEEARPK